MEDVQEILGENQDSVTARSLLRELGVAAHGAAENAFTFGWLHREELARANASREASYSALHRAMAAAHKWPG
jgi:hypothetical protein